MLSLLLSGVITTAACAHMGNHAHCLHTVVVVDLKIMFPALESTHCTSVKYYSSSRSAAVEQTKGGILKVAGESL